MEGVGRLGLTHHHLLGVPVGDLHHPQGGVRSHLGPGHELDDRRTVLWRKGHSSPPALPGTRAGHQAVAPNRNAKIPCGPGKHRTPASDASHPEHPARQRPPILPREFLRTPVGAGKWSVPATNPGRLVSCGRQAPGARHLGIDVDASPRAENKHRLIGGVRDTEAWRSPAGK